MLALSQLIRSKAESEVAVGGVAKGFRVSIVPLLLAVAGHKEEQRATHDNRPPLPPRSCPFPE
jgi:hypothetical protein